MWGNTLPVVPEARLVRLTTTWGAYFHPWTLRLPTDAPEVFSGAIEPEVWAVITTAFNAPGNELQRANRLGIGLVVLAAVVGFVGAMLLGFLSGPVGAGIALLVGAILAFVAIMKRVTATQAVGSTLCDRVNKDVLVERHLGAGLRFVTYTEGSGANGRVTHHGVLVYHPRFLDPAYAAPIGPVRRGVGPALPDRPRAPRPRPRPSSFHWNLPSQHRVSSV